MADRVVVVGAGIGGLVAALELACRGLDVTLLDRAATPGGKMREVDVAGRRLDAGPTVFTMRWVLDAVFATAGVRLEDHLTLRPAAILARHAWPDGSRLDLFADLERTAAAVQAFAGAREAAGFRAFTAQARAIYATLEAPFIRGQRPTMTGLVRSAGLAEMWRIRPFDTLWSALSQHFADP
ncbi:MAG: phytoene desaturase family protein, partial [Janthinobacterium lividum]